MSRSVCLKDGDYYMAMAVLSAGRSKDPVTQVGACIVHPSGQVMSTGYNGMPIGLKDGWAPWDKVALCPASTKHPYICHAESNAIVNARDADLHGCDIYITLFPCNGCAKNLIKAGICRILYLKQKPNKWEMEVSRCMLMEKGVELEQYVPSQLSVFINLRNDALDLYLEDPRVK